MKKINIGIQDFKSLITEGYYYVDKTKVINNIITSNKYYFLSRPRRFGKSIFLSLLKYLYLGEKKLFKGLYIYDKWNWSKINPVIYLSFAGYSTQKDLKEYIYENLLLCYDGKEELLESSQELNIGYIIEKLSKKTGKKVVVLIDEYDKSVLEHLYDKVKAEKIRDYFRGFYAGVKDRDMYIELFMLTGLTKILKMSIFSVLNNLNDISLLRNSNDLLGFTQKEIETYFSEELIDISNILGINKNQLLDKIKERYNGYNFGDKNNLIYNPWNINSLIKNKEIKSYWSSTGLPKFISEYVELNRDKIKELSDNISNLKLIIDETDLIIDKLNNLKAEVVLFNGGYLTVKKNEEGTLTLGFPNQECEDIVLKYFMQISLGDYNQAILRDISLKIINSILQEKGNKLEEALVEMIYGFFGETAYEWINRNPEGWLKTLLGMMMRLNSVYYYPEVENIIGRKDFIIPVQGKYFIIETKVDSTTRKAIDQINKQYIKQFKETDILIKIGINWNRKRRKFKVLIK